MTTNQQKLDALIAKTKSGDIKAMMLCLDLAWPLNKPRDWLRHPIRAFRVYRFMRSFPNWYA